MKSKRLYQNMCKTMPTYKSESKCFLIFCSIDFNNRASFYNSLKQWAMLANFEGYGTEIVSP